MTGLLDTNVIVRYLVGSPDDAAQQAIRIIDGDPDLFVTDVALAEAAFVLMSVYEVPREVAVDHLVALVARTNVTPFRLDKDAVIQGLMLCRPSGRVSFADAMIWAAARSSNTRTVYSFDRRFPTEGLSIRRTIDG